jgi:peptide/nickel transport system permease protein
MTGYIIRRLGQALIVILGVILLTFLLARLIPGGEARAVLGVKATPRTIAEFNLRNGLDLPIWDQFWRYVEGIFVHLDLGYSYKNNQGVRQVIMERLPKTLTLVTASVILSLVVAIPLGILQVVRRNKPIDYAVTGASFFFYAMPDFLVGTLLIIFFAFDLKWFPVSPPSDASALAVFTDPRAFVLPIVTLAVTSIASFSRYMRSSMMEAMAEDYVRTARAKGASNRRVLYGHALRNALIPILTLLGLSLPAIVSGALIVENVFNYPGMGLLTVQSAFNDDVPVVLGTTLVITIATVIGSLLADILYAVADPRIRLGGA